MFNKVAIISIPVSDQQAAKDFYINKMGCTMIQEMPFSEDGNIKWIRLELPGTGTHIVLANWFPQMKPGCIQGLVLTTEDIEKAHTALRKSGLPISEINNQPYAQEATFTDPDGNGWVLQQPK